MITLLIVLHLTTCFLLITLVLIQRGRGGGLVESFSGVESMFGTKANTFLTRTTTVFSIVFFLTCLSLAILSVKQSRSLLANVKPASLTSQPKTTTPPAQPATATIPAQPQAKTPDSPKADQK